MDSQLPIPEKKGKGMADFKSNRLKRIKLKAALTCFVSLATVVAAGSATFAWFSTNKSATASYSNIVARDSSYVTDVKYHKIKYETTTDGSSTGKVTKDDNGNYTYTFDATSTNAIEIEQYSALDESEVHQILIEITLSEDAGSFSVEANAQEDILGSKGWGNIDWNTQPYPLSSIIAFYYVETGDNNITVDNTNNTITIKRGSSENESHFVTLASSTATPTFNTNLILKESSSVKGASIYVMLDYYLDAIRSIYSYNIGNEAFDSDEGLKFGCDFSIAVRPN